MLHFIQAMDIIESMDPVAFSDYLKKYQNTICGRHPIGVLLNVSGIFFGWFQKWCYDLLLPLQF